MLQIGNNSPTVLLIGRFTFLEKDTLISIGVAMTQITDDFQYTLLGEISNFAQIDIHSKNSLIAHNWIEEFFAEVASKASFGRF